MSMQQEIRAKAQSNLNFRLMSLTYKFRDFLLPRMSILKEVGIKTGFHVLDYGCGPGSYIKPLAQLVDDSGMIYALDIHPLAIRLVRRIASRMQLANVQTILSSCETGLPSSSVDVVLLYDLLHDLDHPNRVLAELHRVLKLEGVLSSSDHHLREDDIISRLTEAGLFRIIKKGQKTYSFQKIG